VLSSALSAWGAGEDARERLLEEASARQSIASGAVSGGVWLDTSGSEGGSTTASITQSSRANSTREGGGGGGVTPATTDFDAFEDFEIEEDEGGGVGQLSRSRMLTYADVC
jgi:hypothetical protein